jgi:hypothetical protein
MRSKRSGGTLCLVNATALEDINCPNNHGRGGAAATTRKVLPLRSLRFAPVGMTK